LFRCPLDRARRLGYIEREKLEIPSIYYATSGQVFDRDGLLLADNPYVIRDDNEPLYAGYRALPDGRDMTARGGLLDRPDVAEVIAEVAATRSPERGQTRADDRTSGRRWKPQARGVLLNGQLC